MPFDESLEVFKRLLGICDHGGGDALGGRRSQRLGHRSRTGDVRPRRDRVGNRADAKNLPAEGLIDFEGPLHGFPQVGPPRVGVTVGEPVLIQIRSNYGPAISGLGDRTARGFLSAVYQPLGATDWYEGNADSAGELLAPAQTPTGNGALTTLMGYYNINDRVDMYRIRITSPGSFQATAASVPTGAGAFFYLFNPSGKNLAQGTTLNGAPAAGEYYLAVTPGGMTPVDENFSSLTPGSGGVLADWLGFGLTGIQAYTVTLTGAAVVSPACTADFNNVNGVTVQDIFDFLTAWLAGNPSADFNHVNGVTVQDIFDFLTAWLAGC